MWPHRLGTATVEASSVATGMRIASCRDRLLLTYAPWWCDQAIATCGTWRGNADWNACKHVYYPACGGLPSRTESLTCSGQFFALHVGYPYWSPSSASKTHLLIYPSQTFLT
jgi:hypothetical protein